MAVECPEGRPRTEARFPRTIGALLGSLSVLLPLVYLAGLYLFHAIGFLSFPIQAGDTDLWYHLDSGRYIMSHHAIPRESYFSFVSPARTWSNYYWLFQVVVYQVYAWMGYLGLIGARALAYLGSMTVIGCYLLRRREAPMPRAYAVMLAALYFAMLIPRSILIRPHLVSYLFIVSFLYILEFAPRRRWLLPWLGLAWCNAHGITYPVMLLVTGAYAIEYLVRRIRRDGRDQGQEAQRLLVPVVLCMATIYLTPHGWRLLSIPFTPLSFTARSIQEFQSVSLGQLCSFQWINLVPTYQTIFNALLFLGCAGMLAASLKAPARISHLVIAAGGLYLLTKGLRFTVECALLLLPVITANGLVRARDPALRRPFVPERLMLGAGVVALLLMPAALSGRLLSRQRAYPFSQRGLPVGVGLFLTRLDANGAVLNDPNAGGYLRWVLYPKYKIFLDLEVPFLFTPEDLYLAQRAFQDSEALRTVLRQYQPSFIAAPIVSKTFRDLIKAYPDYTVLFFDDTEVLYVNRRRWPALAVQHELKGVDPFELTTDLSAWQPDQAQREAIERVLPRLIAVHPDGRIANELAARWYNRDEAFDRALPYARTIRKNFPELPAGYALEGDAWAGLHVFDRAAAAYRQAIARTPGMLTGPLYRKLSAAYAGERRFAKAYEALSEATELFSPATSLEDLDHLGSAALLAGRRKEAGAIWIYMYEYRVRSDQLAWVQRLREALAGIGVNLEQEE